MRGNQVKVPRNDRTVALKVLEVCGLRVVFSTTAARQTLCKIFLED